MRKILYGTIAFLGLSTAGLLFGENYSEQYILNKVFVPGGNSISNVNENLGVQALFNAVYDENNAGLRMRLDEVSGPFTLFSSVTLHQDLEVSSNTKFGDSASYKMCIATGTKAGDCAAMVTIGAGTMVVTQAGNVGIGTTAPGSLLHVAGTAQMTRLAVSSSTPVHLAVIGDGSTSQAVQLQINAGASSRGAIRFAQNHVLKGMFGIGEGDDALITGAQKGEMAVYSSSFSISADEGTTNHLKILRNGNIGIGASVPGGKLVVASGNVGIGTTTPVSKLEVASGFKPPSVAAANIGAQTAGQIGEVLVCPDCTLPYSICASTGTQAGSWVLAGTVASPHCQ